MKQSEYPAAARQSTKNTIWHSTSHFKHKNRSSTYCSKVNTQQQETNSKTW